MKFEALKKVAAMLVAVALLLPVASQGASAGVLDELRSRGFGKWVDRYVEEKNGSVKLKKSANVSNVLDSAGIKAADKPKSLRSAARSLDKKTVALNKPNLPRKPATTTTAGAGAAGSGETTAKKTAAADATETDGNAGAVSAVETTEPVAASTGEATPETK